MLRALAALMVVLFHLNQAIAPADNWYRNTVKHGALGVPVFFVISGYCIIISANNSPGIKDFLIKRFFRIYPAYWISLIVVGIAACFQKVYIGSNAVHYLPRTLSAVTANLMLATAPLSQIKTVNWVYWSLTCELLFYLTVGLMLLAEKQLMIYLLIAVSLTAALLPAQNTGVLFFSDHWPAFGLGLSLYYFFNRAGKATFFHFSALLIINLLGLFKKFYIHTDYIIFTLAAFALIMASHYVNLSNNVLSRLGRYSYGVYLIHVPVGVFMLGLLESDYIKQRPFLNFVYDLSVYGLTAIAAWAIFEYVEKPSIKYGHLIARYRMGSRLKFVSKLSDTVPY